MWEEVTHIDEEMAALRRDLTRCSRARSSGRWSRGQRPGWSRDDLDPAGMATALTSMVDRYCYVTFAVDDEHAEPPPVDDAVDLLTGLWADAIGLVERNNRR